MGWVKHLEYACVFVLTASWVGGPAWAREDIIPGSRYTSARCAAMGGACLPIGDDGGSALFDNPADVGQIEHIHFEPLNAALYVNSGFLQSLTSNFFNVIFLNNYLGTLSSAPGDYQGVGWSVLPNFAMKGIAVGILGQTQLAAIKNTDGTISYRSLYQLIPSASVGLRLARGIVRIGYSFQWVNTATTGAGPITVAAGPVNYNDNLYQGSGFSHNAGLALTIPVSFLPSFNIVARNIFNLVYTYPSIVSVASGSAGAPASEPMTFDGSVSVQPKLGHGLFLNIVAEYQDLQDRAGVPDLLAHLIGGVELSYLDKFYARGGFGEGYPSFGLGFRTRAAEFAFAYYSEEAGIGYLSQQDTHFMFQFRLGFM